MQQLNKDSVSGSLFLFILLLNAVVIKAGFIQNSNFYPLLFMTIPLLGHTIYNMKKTKEMVEKKENAVVLSVEIHSKVTIKDGDNGKMMVITIVTPDKVNIKEQKISINSPLASVLIGKSIGEQVLLKTAIGSKTYTILNVE